MRPNSSRILSLCLSSTDSQRKSIVSRRAWQMLEERWGGLVAMALRIWSMWLYARRQRQERA